MGARATSQVVLVPFPFSDLSHTKIRPAAVLAYAGRDDWILCQITSNPYGDPNAVTLTNENFSEGSLRLTSYARPGKLFTANSGLVSAVIGTLDDQTVQSLVEAVIKLLKPDVN
jgi:mRNA interferase MazF